MSQTQHWTPHDVAWGVGTVVVVSIVCYFVWQIALILIKAVLFVGLVWATVRVLSAVRSVKHKKSEDAR